MIKKLTWYGKRIGEDAWFPANVPGNIQNDYGIFHNFGDVNYGDNCLRYIEMEDSTWLYKAEFEIETKDRVFFVSGGIDYIFEITLNGEIICSHEGMFSKIEEDITEKIVSGKNTIEVKVFPHPKREGAELGRDQADHSCKSPVCYGWDFHPRVLVSGIWNDAYLEIRSEDYIKKCEVSYELTDNLAEVNFDVDNGCKIEFYAPSGEIVYCGQNKQFSIKNPLLWWCNGEGEPNLYTYKVKKGSFEKCGTVGFRNIKLIMNKSAWYKPSEFPKSRTVVPTQICLNGRNVFAKGSNFVNPEIFMGTVNFDTYEPLVKQANEANMNIFRVWGGAGIGKEDFYELCDKYGIMVWQEFPLACNCYPDDSHYLKILEQEARDIVKLLRKHPCVVLWCGGNELFNCWSKMTDQSLPLRLLNKICYELDPKTPFIATSPLMGMAHGGYTFYLNDKNQKQEVYEEFNNAKYTAYTEFGVQGMSDPEHYKTFIPENELFPPKNNNTWRTHKAYEDWDEDVWLCLEVVEKYFGKIDSLEDLCEYSSWLQCEGYKAIFEEARRQKPYCSMAINWCYNEPWKNVANNSLLTYPSTPKKAYYTVKNSLRSVVPSARLNKFEYEGGELFVAELWLLNDSQESVSDEISVYIEIGEAVYHILDWKTECSGVNENIKGHIVQFVLPESDAECFVLKLKSKKYGDNEYRLKYKSKEIFKRVNRLNF